MFSQRLPADLSPSPLARELEELTGLWDLTVSNPTRVGIDYPQAAICAALAEVPLWPYAPASLGLAPARRAIAARLGVDAERLVLTASTSEAYGYLVKLLCDPGDTVAVPVPSYPLLPHLLELEAVRAEPYRLFYSEGAWHIDLEAAARVVADGARCLLLVSPNNPTGSVPSAAEAAALRRLCAAHGCAVICDQVFAPYRQSGAPSSWTLDDGPLTFVLDGLSKRAGMPQLKLAWIGVYGPAPLRREALAGLEWIADAYLSVGTPVQLAVGGLLDAAPVVQSQLNARIGQNDSTLRAALAPVAGVQILARQGGWYAVVALGPELSVDEEELTQRLARVHRVQVQPGYFYDFPDGTHLVVSLIVPELDMRAGAAALASGLAQIPGL